MGGGLFVLLGLLPELGAFNMFEDGLSLSGELGGLSDEPPQNAIATNQLQGEINTLKTETKIPRRGCAAGRVAGL